MNQKITFQAFATTLAALGLAACGSSAPVPPAQSPVQATEVPAAAPAPAAGTAAADAAPATPASPAAAPAAAPAPAASADSTTPAAAPASGTDAPKPAGKKKAAGAKAGCGPGTCG